MRKQNSSLTTPPRHRNHGPRWPVGNLSPLRQSQLRLLSRSRTSAWTALYVTYREDGKSRSLYVPPEHAKAARQAQQAWAAFWEIGCSLAKLNRDRLRKQWQQEKQSRTHPLGGTPMIDARRQQLHFGEGLIAEEVRLARRLDEARRPGAGGRATGGDRVRGPGQTQSEEPHPRPPRHAGRSGAAAAAAEAHPQLELRGVGARSPGQSGVSRFHASGSRQSTRCQDHGSLGIGAGTGGCRKDS